MPQEHCASGDGPENDQIENDVTFTESENNFKVEVKNNDIDKTGKFNKFDEQMDSHEKNHAEGNDLNGATDSEVTQTPCTDEPSMKILESSQANSTASEVFVRHSCDPVLSGKVEFQHERTVGQQESRETARDALDEKPSSLHDEPGAQNGTDITDHHLSYTEDYAHIDTIDFDTRLFDDKIESIDCDICFVEGKLVFPTSYCYVCQIYLCGSCYRFHSKIPGTCNHSVVHRNDLIKSTFKQPTTYEEEKRTAGIFFFHPKNIISQTVVIISQRKGLWELSHTICFSIFYVQIR